MKRSNRNRRKTLLRKEGREDYKGLIKGYSARTEEQRTFGTPCTRFCRRFGDQEIQQILFAMNFEGVGVIQRTICPLF